MSKRFDIYIASDWYAPPIALVERLETAGCTIIPKWWEDRKKRSGNMKLLVQEVNACDVFILDLRGPRFGTHYYAGSHIALGMAVMKDKQIYVIAGVGETKVTEPMNTYSTLTAKYVCTEDEVVEKLRNNESQKKN